MTNESLSGLVKQIDSQVNIILRRLDMRKLDKYQQAGLSILRQSLKDARVYAQSYELSEIREAQLANAKQAKKRLSQAGLQILNASKFNVFGAADVAHLSAQIEQLISSLK